MYRPGGYAPQYRHGPPGVPIQQYPAPEPRPVYPPMMQGGPQTMPPAFPGGQQQNFGYGPPPAMLPQVSPMSPGFPPVSMQSVPNHGTQSSAPPFGVLPSRPPFEQHHFQGPPPGPPLPGPPPQLPIPRAANFIGTLPHGPPPPQPPSFSPLFPPQPSPAFEFSQPAPPSYSLPQQLTVPPPPAVEVSQSSLSSQTLPQNMLPPPPPPPALDACQLPPPTHSQPRYPPQYLPQPPALEFSQPPPPSTDALDQPPSSHTTTLPPPPQVPNDEEMVQNIEILSEFVVKNGPEFENMARAKQAGNPKFSFLFDGAPSSDAAIGYQYFQWMKKKWELQITTSEQVENQGQSIQPSETPMYSQQSIDPKLSVEQVPTSPAVSDMDMDDDFVLTTTSNKDPQDLHYSHATGVCKTSDEQESGNLSYNSTIQAANGGEKNELIPTKMSWMDTWHSDHPGEIRQTTKLDDQTVDNEIAKNSSFNDMPQAGSNAMPEDNELYRNNQDLMAANLTHNHIGPIYENSKMLQISGFARKSQDNMADDNIGYNEMQAPNRNVLRETSNYFKHWGQHFSWDTDVTEDPGHEIIDGNLPAKEGEERIKNYVKEGTSDSESDEVLYSANELRKGRRSSKSQSPAGSRLRSRSRSPRHGGSLNKSPRIGDSKNSYEKTKAICLHFARGACHKGSSCEFLHQKAIVNNIVDYSDEESEKSKQEKEMEQDLPGSLGGFERSVVVDGKLKSTSPGGHSGGHDNPGEREENSQGETKSDDSNGKDKKSPEWDLDLFSESYSAHLDREIFQHSLQQREKSGAQPLPRDDFRPLPLRKEDFEPQALSREDKEPLQREDSQAQFLQLRGEDSRAHGLPREEVHRLSLVQEEMQRLHPQPLHLEAVRSQGFLREDLQAQHLIHEDVRTKALLREGLSTEPFSRENLHAPLLREDLRAHPLLREDLRAHTLLREELRSQPLFRGGAYGRSLIRDDLRVPPSLRDDYRRVNLLRKDILLEPLLRGDSRVRDEDLRSYPMLREDLHLQHLLRQNSRVRSEGLLPREDMHPSPFSREDLPAHRLNASMGRFESVLSRNPSIHHSSSLPVNSSLSSHVSLISSSDPLRLGHLTSSSLFDKPSQHSVLAERRAPNPESSISMNPNHVGHPELLFARRDPHPRSPLSPPIVYRTGSQPQPTPSGSRPLSISEELQAYRYSHAGLSVPVQSTLHPSSSTPGSQYDPLYDSIEPPFGSKLFGSSGGEHGNVTGAMTELDTNPRLQNAGPEYDGVRIKTGLLRQPDRKFEADGLEAATDAEVGTVDNESPHLEGAKGWSHGHPLEVATAGAGEIDVDQTHANEKTKNIKEMKALKIFRTALAEFAKEILKPTWREGHMSKEEFKTIVKKAVDKVAGSLQSHQIPNTQERIEQYLESSRVKFTKLVEGYVEKYVKG